MRRLNSRALTSAAGGLLVIGALALVGCTPQGNAATTDPGGALLERRCSICHTLDRINSATKDEAGWNATIDRMRTKGAVVSEEEQKALVAYLLSK